MIAVAFRTFSICFFANAYNLSVEELDDRRAQCPVTETVDSLRIIIADWADEGKRGRGGISLRAHAALNGSLSSTQPPQLSSAQQLPRIRKLEQILCTHPPKRAHFNCTF